jgi:hypothetical protein
LLPLWVTKERRELPRAYSPDGWYKLEETANEKKVFAVIGMKDMGFVSVAGVQVQLQKAARLKKTHETLLPI